MSPSAEFINLLIYYGVSGRKLALSILIWAFVLRIMHTYKSGYIGQLTLAPQTAGRRGKSVQPWVSCVMEKVSRIPVICLATVEFNKKTNNRIF